MGNAIVERDSEGNTRLIPRVPPMEDGESASLIAVIARAASDPAVNIDKLERLMQMHERLQAQRAKVAYDAALAEMQPKLPVVGRRGRIEVREKDSSGKRTGDIQQSTAYALWEDINDAIKPLLAEHGFALSFRVARDGDRVLVTGILSHRDGHREETTLPAPLDTTGSKNNVQAVGSSLSYGKRYTAGALLNITTRGEDDDGKAAGGDFITPEQVEWLQTLMNEVGADPVKFRAFMKIESLSELPAGRYDAAVKALEQKRAKK